MSKKWVKSGVEMLAIGGIAAAIASAAGFFAELGWLGKLVTASYHGSEL